VQTTFGPIRGVALPGVAVFKGVRYGASTAGRNRFQPPRRPEPWTRVRDASEYGRRAWQPFRPMIPEIGDAFTGSGPMDEDCLHLNVWTPAADRGRRPVMVWFHGGGQRTGSSNSVFYDGSALARHHDVVLVGVNHRLNAFGYLWLAGLPAAGEQFARTANLPLLDLVAALEWVRDNIAQFGGDPANVTIGGQSGGGGKTAMLSALPAARGLFHRAIIMSTLAETAVTGLEPARAVEAAEELLGRLGLTPSTAHRLIDMPARQIVDALTGSGQTGSPRASDISLRFVPVVDGTTLPAHPFEPLASPLSADIPLMLGSNECEGIPYGNPDDPYWAGEPSSHEELRRWLKGVLPVDDVGADRLIALYRSGRPADTFGDLAAVISGDTSALRQSANTIAQRKFQQGRAPAYLYYFNWRSPVRAGKLRSMHGMELPFVFDHPDDLPSMTGTGSDLASLARAMSGAWAAFARTGNPNHAAIPTWPAFDARTRPTMVFGRRIESVSDPFGDERRALEAARQRG
jgi:para-nitrobenzyl esterase